MSHILAKQVYIERCKSKLNFATLTLVVVKSVLQFFISIWVSANFITQLLDNTANKICLIAVTILSSWRLCVYI